MRLALSVCILALAGCTMPFEDFEPRQGDAALSETAIDASKDVATDVADACTCVKHSGGKCRTWNPPGCGD